MSYETYPKRDERTIGQMDKPNKIRAPPPQLLRSCGHKNNEKKSAAVVIGSLKVNDIFLPQVRIWIA